nr:TIGR03862 family flavoprotein [Hartmannibacter diazotrophicus]
METDVAIIGGGPAGLMAAEVLSAHGLRVHLFDAMPSVGRKLLMAGKSGLNLTHAEPMADFLGRYGDALGWLKPAIDAFPPGALRAWADNLGAETFVGSSGKVFPKAMKASPLLRAWLRQLNDQGVTILPRHRWTGWTKTGVLAFETSTGPLEVTAKATLLALGGASWPRLGSDGTWQRLLAERGVEIAPLVASNCGFDVDWSPYLVERFAGQPVRPVRMTLADKTVDGEFVITRHGVEGNAIYRLGPEIRRRIDETGSADILVDLCPDRDLERLQRELSQPRGRQSLANHLRKRAGIAGAKAALLRECVSAEILQDPHQLAHSLKALRLRLVRSRPIEEAISTAGGVAASAFDDTFQLLALPGVFVAGEMLGFDAPTGGYLLTACLATGHAAANGILDGLACIDRDEFR